MSTGNMPNPPDHLTTQVNAPGVQEQTAHIEEQAQPEAPLALGEELARIIENKLDVIAQSMNYHAQMMLGVSAIATDVVNARYAAQVVADGLRSQAPAGPVHALVNLGTPQISQVNDRTLPFKLNLQLAGLLEGIIADTIQRALSADASRAREARVLLAGIFQPANEAALRQPKSMLSIQGPGPGPNARK